MIETLHTRTIYPFELETATVVSPEHSVRIALARTKTKSAMKPVFTAWPTLEDATRKLARIVTHGYPREEDGSDILSAAIRKALEAYEAASTDAVVESALADAFMLAMVNDASSLVGFDVHGMRENGKTERWEHLSAPLTDWCKKKHFERLVFSPRGVFIEPRERAAAKMLLACQILTVRDTARLFTLAG